MIQNTAFVENVIVNYAKLHPSYTFGEVFPKLKNTSIANVTFENIKPLSYKKRCKQRNETMCVCGYFKP